MVKSIAFKAGVDAKAAGLPLNRTAFANLRAGTKQYDDFLDGYNQPPPAVINYRIETCKRNAKVWLYNYATTGQHFNLLHAISETRQALAFYKLLH